LVPVFAGVALIISLLPVILLARLPEGMVLPVSFLVRVVFPAFLASIGIAFATVIFHGDAAGDEPSSGSVTRRLADDARDLGGAGLLSGILGLTMVVLLGGVGLFMLPLFFGPPILVQVITLEHRSLVDGWYRTRALMAGSWARVILVIAVVVLGTALAGTLVLTGGFVLTREMSDVGRAISFTVLQSLVAGVTLPYLAAISFVTYADLVNRASPQLPSVASPD
jgi:hypothetical protein